MEDILVSLHIATIISAASVLKAGMVLSAKTANLHTGATLRRHYQGAARIYSNGGAENEFAPNLPDALEYFDHNIDDMNPDFANLIQRALQLAQQVGRPNHSHAT